MNAVAYTLGQLIGLAIIPGALIWALRGPIGRLRRGRRARQANAYGQAIHDRYVTWQHNLQFWAHEKRRHPHGTLAHGAASDMLEYFSANPVTPCRCLSCQQLCPHAAFDCRTPGCSIHPRSYRS